MELQFTKMQALGNDFVVLDGVRQTLDLSPAQIRHLADRRLGVGCDQLLIVSPATQTGADFNYQIFNADGSQAEQCGNGARCVARFIAEQKLSDKSHLVLQTLRGLITTQLLALDKVKVSLGEPQFLPEKIPFHAAQQQLHYTLPVSGQTRTFGALSVGNPHAVLLVDDVAQAPLDTVGQALEHHPAFAQRTNVEFMAIAHRGQIHLRVWERGVGETPACGSGACAAVIMGWHWGLLDNAVDVVLPGGTLQVDYAGTGQPVWLTGPADNVFSGLISL